MNSCPICHTEIKLDQSCESCNPFTRARWTRKLTVFASGFLAVLSLWLILFAVSIATETFVSSLSSSPLGIGVLGSAASAALLLITGLGGSVWVAAGESTVASISFPLLVIPILLWLLLRFTIKRFLPREAPSVSNGLFYALGAIVSILLIGGSAGSSQTIAGQVVTFGLNSLIPLIVLSLMAYVSFSGTLSWPSLENIGENFRQYLGSQRRFQRVIWRVLIGLGLYAALIAGTGLVSQPPLIFWPSVGLGLLLLVPTAAFVVGPFFLGAPIANTDIFALGESIAQMNEWKNNGQWLSWIVVAIAGVVVLTSIINSAAKSKPDSNGWWKGTIVGAAFGLSTGLLGSVNLDINFLIFDYSQQLGLNSAYLAILFSAIGLVRGLFLHPVFHSVAQALDESPGAQWRQLIGLLGLQHLSIRKSITAFFSTKHFVVRKIAKYASVFTLVGAVFLFGHPLAWATQPFYDNSGTGFSRFENALKTGEAKEISRYIDAYSFFGVEAIVGSSGLGDKSDLKVVADKKLENTHRISWSKNTFYIEVVSIKSLTKPAFWGIIPQWDASVSKSNFPKMSAKFNKQVITDVIVGNKIVALNEIFFIPGKVEWTPQTDKQKFVKTGILKFDASKRNVLKFDYQLVTGVQAEMLTTVENSFEIQYKAKCKTTTFKPLTNASLGAYNAASGFVQLVASGKGTCESKNAGEGKIDFAYDAKGTYSASAQKWLWSFDFK